MFAALLVAAAFAQAAAAEDVYPIRREIPLGQPVATARDAMALARADLLLLAKLDPSIPKFCRYVWIPDWIEPASGFAQVAHVMHSTFTRTSNLPQPVLVSAETLPKPEDGSKYPPGVLVRIDLLKLAAKDELVGQVVNLYEKLAPFDSWFNVKAIVKGDVAIIVPDSQPQAGDEVQMLLQGGTWATGKLVSWDGNAASVEYKGKTYPTTSSQVKWKGKLLSEIKPAEHKADEFKAEFTAAPYLNPEGAEVFTLTHSSVPIMRLDEWVAFTFSSVNNGLYYKLTGIKENLADTIREFCGNDAAVKVIRQTSALRAAEAEQRRAASEGRPIESLAKIAGRVDPDLAKSRCLIQESGVTGRQRVCLFFFGTATAPTSGVQLVAVTFDIAEGNGDPNSDPLRNASVFETYDGGEAIFALSNGMLAYIVFDNKDTIIASVPDKVASDHQYRRVRANASTARVFAGVSCANCHDAGENNWGWQPVVNDLQDTVRGLSQILDDRGQRSSIEALQLLTAQYSATSSDLKAMLDQARLPYQYRANLATNFKTTRETVAGLADSYWGYWYDAVTPEVAARDFGQSLNHEDACLFLLRAIDPARAKNVEQFLREDGALLRIKEGKSLVPAQWRTIIQSVSERLYLKPVDQKQVEPAGKTGYLNRRSDKHESGEVFAICA